METTVFVVMGNDFPSAVFTTEAAAEEYCRLRREENERNGMRPGRIYWRVYKFPLSERAEQ